MKFNFTCIQIMSKNVLHSYPVANVPASVGHGRAAMAPPPAARAASGTAAAGTGARAGIVPS